MSEDVPPPAPDRHETFDVGVIVERRKASNPWQDYAWQAVEVVPVIPPLAPWSVLREEGGTTRFFAGVFTLELHTRETVSYRENLVAETPSIYVVLRPDASAPCGMRLELATPSPADAEAYLVSGNDIVDKVPMPLAIEAWLSAYVAAFHVEERFDKRRRGRDKPGARRVS